MNPIVRRELLDLLRTRTAVAVLVAFALVTAVLVLLHWPVAGVGDLGGTAALGVLRVFGYGLLTGLLLVLPAFPAAAIVRERVRGTLALLLNSPMTPAAIYGGKFGGAIGFTFILLLLTIPGAAASYALGGSTVTGGVGLLYVVLIVAAVQVTAIALFISGRSLTTDGALARGLHRRPGGDRTAPRGPDAHAAERPRRFRRRGLARLHLSNPRRDGSGGARAARCLGRGPRRRRDRALQPDRPLDERPVGAGHRSRARSAFRSTAPARPA